jgi:peptidoglycan hydrolase-like protein with peptidoglycan-binding domain
VFVKRIFAVVCTALLLSATTLPAAAQSDKWAAIGNLNMSGVPSLDRDSVRQVQRALETKGFDPGRIDGVAGPATRAAVQKFQDHFGIKASGEIDNQTLFALGKADLALR